MKTIVLIPAYNEESKIGDVVTSVIDSGKQVLVIDDGSTDNTAKVAKDSGAVVLSHKINRGQGASLKTGIEYARLSGYELVVFFDADGQMKVDEISTLVGKIGVDGCEVVLGSRFLGKTENIPLAKLITLKLALWFTRVSTGLKLTDTHNGFQAWTIVALNKISLTQDRQAYASELLAEISEQKINYCEFPVTIKYTNYSRLKGQSIFNAFNILWDLIIKR